MLICNNCNWQGLPEELVALTDDPKDKDFKYCPYCDSDDFYEDKEEEDCD